MALSVILLVIAILVVAIWFLFGFKRMKHKIVAILLIAMVLFSFFSFNSVFKGKEISINSISDFGNIAKIYFSWLGNIFGNIKTITGNAVEMNWKGNQTEKAT